MTGIPQFYTLFSEDIGRIERPGGSRCYIRLEKSLDVPLDILKLTTSYDIPELLYFKDKNSLNQFGGLGSAHVIMAPSPEEAMPMINEILGMDSRIRLFGGFSFSHDAPASGEWAGFSNCRFTLPLIEIQKRDRKNLIILNYYSGCPVSPEEIRSSLADRLKAIDSRISRKESAVRFQSESEILVPDRADWVKILDKALARIQTGEIDKIVLSRKKIVRNRNPWDLYAIMNKLNMLKEESFLFFYKIGDGTAFLGRSPERLFKIKNKEFTVESIAGTRPRGKTQEDDFRLERELLSSPKELEEHRIVSRFIRESMDNFCSGVTVKINEGILKLHNLQHIITLFSGTVEGDIDLLKLLNTFHPTPAVGGHPKDAVFRIIPALEPFHRGWYAAPIGWVRRGEGNFAVGIRSALIQGRDLHIFAGAGIVRQSDPVEEWDETDNKMDNFLKGLGDL